MLPSNEKISKMSQNQIWQKSTLEFVKNTWVLMWMNHIWSFQDEDHFNCLWKQNIKRFCLKEHYYEWTSEFDMQMRLLHFFDSTAFSNMQRSNEFRRLIGIHFKHKIVFFCEVLLSFIVWLFLLESRKRNVFWNIHMQTSFPSFLWEIWYYHHKL